jgi:hypothetical protein
LLPFFKLAFYSFPSADDFCYAVDARNGFWQSQRMVYLVSSGRYTSTFLISLFGLFDLSVIYPWFSFMTLLATLIAFRILVGAVNTNPTPELGRWVASGAAMSVFIGNLPSTVEAYYWLASTITYQWAIIVYLIWIALLINITRDSGGRHSPWWMKVTTILLTMLLPGLNELFVPIILGTLIAFNLICWWSTKKSNRFMTVLLATAIALCCVMVFAPGNRLRSTIYPDHPSRYNLEFALMKTVLKGVEIILNYADYPSIWVAAVAVWMWVLLPSSKLSGGWTHFLLTLAGICVLIFGMFITLFPIFWVYGENNYSGEGRTYNITYFIFSTASVWTSAVLLSAISKHLPNLRSGMEKMRPYTDLFLS